MNGGGDRAGRGWFKSSHSNPSNNCVEVMITSAAVRIRDTKSPGTSPEVAVSGRAWNRFLEQSAES
ncbi:DUF397 domain-containing protein [Actinosynnema sp. NPDC023587]|uniref:DUF397 domain-containing protein n=1 Tax=Actinosynnema sp. NPDC023587 TaxID=3154695 RepID=UPI0033F43228